MAVGTAIGLGAAAAIGATVNAISQHNTNKQSMSYQTSEREAAQAYNNPVEQRKRFEAAGINPYFALGQMDAGNTTAQSSPNLVAPQYGDIASGLLNGAMQGYELNQRDEQLRQLQLGTEQMKVDTRYKLTEKLLQLSEERAKIYGMDIDNKAKQKQLSVLDKTIEQLQLDIDATRQDWSESRKTAIAQRKIAELDVKSKELANDYQSYMNDLQKQLGPRQVQLLEAEIRSAYSQIGVNKAHAANLIADAALKAAEEKGVRIDNFQKNKINWLIREGVKLDNSIKRYDATHPSSLEKMLGNAPSLEHRNVPKVEGLSHSWTDESGTTRW